MLKHKEGESYGFHLRVERGCRGHVIRQVEPWGVAERAGLRDGDRLLEVNEDFVDDHEHMEVRWRTSGICLFPLYLNLCSVPVSVPLISAECLYLCSMTLPVLSTCVCAECLFLGSVTVFDLFLMTVPVFSDCAQ